MLGEVGYPFLPVSSPVEPFIELPEGRKVTQMVLTPRFLRDPERFQHLRKEEDSELGIRGGVGKCQR